LTTLTARGRCLRYGTKKIKTLRQSERERETNRMERKATSSQPQNLDRPKLSN